MKLFRYFTFLLSILIISGHDVVPHFHDEDHSSAEHSSTLPISSDNGLVILQNLLSHFNHCVNESHLVYTNTAEKQTSFQKDFSFPLTFFTSVYNPLIWYANYKKQRFKDYIKNPPDYQLNTSSLRGPPIS